MELVKSSISNVYEAIKSSFKTSSNFKVGSNSKRSVIKGENIEIIGTTVWQKFEEKQYFNGKRTIKLTLGRAKILRDGIEEVMVQNVEYEILMPQNTPTYSTLTPIYNGSYLNIKQGWNLIANPINQEVDITQSLQYATETYKFKNNEWLKNETKLSQNEGIWVNYSAHVSEKIDGEAYEPNFANLSNDWNLIGAGRDINLAELVQFDEVWAYDSKVKNWVKNPKIIYRGYGFWGK